MLVRNSQQNAGFTVIEFLMVAVITAVISVVMAKILFQGYLGFMTANDIFQADWQGWSGIQRISEDMHRIYSRNAITTASSSLLSFNDIDGNSVQYQLSGGTLLRNGQTLATGIQGLNFGYLDSNGAATATMSSIRYISVTVSAAYNNIPASFSTLMGIRQ